MDASRRMSAPGRAHTGGGGAMLELYHAEPVANSMQASVGPGNKRIAFVNKNLDDLQPDAPLRIANPHEIADAVMTRSVSLLNVSACAGND